MTGNKQAYDAAYHRALQGHSGRGIIDRVMGVFEDDYTRRSREQGERDGAAAREASVEQNAVTTA